MIRNLRYVNSRGDEARFGGREGPWRFGQLNIFDTAPEYTSVGGTVTGFHSGIRAMSLAAVMREGSAAELDRLVDVLSYDLAVGEAGTLWAGGSFMRCWFAGWELSEWGHYDSMAVLDCTVLSDRPVWVRSAEQTLTVREESGGGLDYPHGYPHDYLYGAGASQVVTNPFMLPAKLDIAIAGPCASPYVIVGGNRYQVMTSVDKGSLLLVRGYGPRRGCVVRASDGSERSVFAQRVAEEGADLFAEVPPGRSVAAWSGAYNVTLTMYEERWTPAWST